MWVEKRLGFGFGGIEELSELSRVVFLHEKHY